MGLLSRAGKKPAQLDEMGKALRERIGGLPKKTTPYTVLSLLKAYGAFQTGICLSLKDKNYSSYTSVGLGVEKVSIPLKQIWSSGKAREKYVKFASGELKMADKDSAHWVFPLDVSGEGPWQTIMILGAQEASDFNPDTILAILEDASGKLVLQKKEKTGASTEINVDDDSSVEAFADVKGGKLEEEISLFHRMHLDFSCIVLENPGDTDFCSKVTVIVDKTGTVLSLPSGHSLILLPIVLDRELIAHRLSKTLNTKILLSFEANNPENVITRVDSLA